MNARHPVLSLFTADPVADATRYDDARDAEDAAYEAEIERAQEDAPLILLAQLQALKPGDWFKSDICLGAAWSPDEMLSWGIEKDDDLKNAVAEMMTSPDPKVQKVLQLMAKLFGRDYAMDICLALAEARH